MTNETDIGAELYALVKAEFERSIAADRTLGRLSSMKDADEYAHKVGAHLAAALAKYVKPEALPDGKLYYNIAEKVLAPTLRENHRLINDACAKVQELLDERQGLKLRPQRGEYPEERVHELINAASHAEEWSKTESILTDSVRTLTDSFYAENVRANADFRSRAGLSVEIVREGSSKCCQWCAGLVGRYAYPNEVPKAVYRRHDNCTCSVTYVNGRDRQNVWTKARWTASAERAVRLEKAENAEKPVRFTREQARELEKRLTGGAYGGKIESENYAIAGLMFISHRDDLYKYAVKVPPIENYEDIVFHADRQSFLILDPESQDIERRVSPAELAILLRNSNNYKGGNIRLLSCQAGYGENSLAEQLANELGVSVKAPTEILAISNTGETFISDNRVLLDMWENGQKVQQTGDWADFKPEVN